MRGDLGHGGQAVMFFGRHLAKVRLPFSEQLSYVLCPRTVFHLDHDHVLTGKIQIRREHRVYAHQFDVVAVGLHCGRNLGFDRQQIKQQGTGRHC